MFYKSSFLSPFSRIDDHENKNLDNLDAYLYSDRQSSNFLNLEIQSSLHLRGNGSYAAISIESVQQL